MDKNSLYQQICIFIAKFSYKYIEGITEEIKEYFFRLQTEGKREVKDFALFFDHETNHYRVAVILEEYNFSTANSIFISFLGFIAYAGVNITASQQGKQGMHYVLASFNGEGRGFYCEVDFLSKEPSVPKKEEQKEQGVSSLTIGELQSSQRHQHDVKWKFKIDSANYLPLLASQNLIYNVGGEGDLYAIDAEQGTLRWYWKAEQQHAKITTLPSVDHGVLSVYTSARSQPGIFEATLFTLDAQTGQVLWSSTVPALQSIGLCHLITTQDGITYLGGTNRNMLPAGPQSLCLAIDLQTRIQKWSVDLGGHLGTTTPVITNTRVYLVTFDVQHGLPHLGYLHSLDAQNGVEIWQHTFETHSVQEIVADSTDIFVAGKSLEVIDALTGITKWSLPNLHVFRESSLAVSDKLIYIGYERIPVGRGEPGARKSHEILLAGGSLRLGEIMAVDRVSRQPLWVRSLTHGHSFLERLMIAGEVLYTTWKHLDIRGDVTNATLFALDMHTGQERWRFEANDLSAPLVVDGMVFIRGREDQNEYIYALS